MKRAGLLVVLTIMGVGIVLPASTVVAAPAPPVVFTGGINCSFKGTMTFTPPITTGTNMAITWTFTVPAPPPGKGLYDCKSSLGKKGLTQGGVTLVDGGSLTLTGTIPAGFVCPKAGPLFANAQATFTGGSVNYQGKNGTIAPSTITPDPDPNLVGVEARTQPKATGGSFFLVFTGTGTGSFAGPFSKEILMDTNNNFIAAQCQMKGGITEIPFYSKEDGKYPK
jgi:hypothetical protein